MENKVFNTLWLNRNNDLDSGRYIFHLSDDGHVSNVQYMQILETENEYICRKVVPGVIEFETHFAHT